MMRLIIDMNQVRTQASQGGMDVIQRTDAPFIESVLPKVRGQLVCFVTSSDTEDRQRFWDPMGLAGYASGSDPFYDYSGRGTVDALNLVVCDTDDVITGSGAPEGATLYWVVLVSRITAMSSAFEKDGDTVVTVYVEDSYQPNQGSTDRTFPRLSHWYNIRVSQLKSQPVNNSLLCPTMRELRADSGESVAQEVGALTQINMDSYGNTLGGGYQASHLVYKCKDPADIWYDMPCLLTKTGRVSLSGDIFRHLKLTCAGSGSSNAMIIGHFASPIAYKDASTIYLWWAALRFLTPQDSTSIVAMTDTAGSSWDISTMSDLRAFRMIWC